MCWTTHSAPTSLKYIIIYDFWWEVWYLSLILKLENNVNIRYYNRNVRCGWSKYSNVLTVTFLNLWRPPDHGVWLSVPDAGNLTRVLILNFVIWHFMGFIVSKAGYGICSFAHSFFTLLLKRATMSELLLSLFMWRREITKRTLRPGNLVTLKHWGD